MGQPGSRERPGAHFAGGDLGGLQRRGHDHEPVASALEHELGRGQGRGLPGTGGAFDHDQPMAATQRTDSAPLGVVEVPAPQPDRLS